MVQAFAELLVVFTVIVVGLPMVTAAAPESSTFRSAAAQFTGALGVGFGVLEGLALAEPLAVAETLAVGLAEPLAEVAAEPEGAGEPEGAAEPEAAGEPDGWTEALGVAGAPGVASEEGFCGTAVIWSSSPPPNRLESTHQIRLSATRAARMASARRTQYVVSGSGPAGWITEFMV
ncbi:hypothetical protein GCM10009599_12650 [Luteococcus peritonei]